MSPTEDRSAFESLVRRCHGDVYRAAYGLLGRSDEAEDVTQQVFLKVLERRVRLEGAREPSHVLQWFARRAALERLRSDGRRKRREEDAAMARNDPDSSATPVEQEERRRLWAEVASLLRELRDAVLLRFQEGRDFAAIGDALACSPATAHARLGRALEKLRRRLSRGGTAVAVGRLETLLATRAAVEAIPAALEAKLLGLAGAKTAGVGVAAVLAGLGLATAAAVIGWLVLVPPWEATSPPTLPAPGRVLGAAETTPPGRADSVSGRDALAIATVPFGPGTSTEAPTPAPPPPSTQDEPRLANGVISGTVVDSAGKVVPGVAVSAISEERRGKLAAYVVQARSDVLGRFRLEVPARPEGQSYHLELGGEGYVPRRTDVFLVSPLGEVERGAEGIERDDFEREGAFRLVVRLVDAQGAGVAKAAVGLHRVQRRERGEALRYETGGLSDERGVIILAGQHLGLKLLRIEARSVGFHDVERRLALPLPQGEELVVTLERGLSISGTIATTEGPLEGGARIHLRSPERWLFANQEPDGRFALTGLEPGSYDVHAGGGDYSPVTFRSIRAGEDGLRITLKRYHDRRDHGDHDGEIHGELVDAANGATLVAGPFDTEVHRVESDDRDLLVREILPSLVPEFVGQRAAEHRTESDPGFHHVGLAPGIYVVSVRRRGCAPVFSDPIRLGERGLASGLRLAAGPGAAFEGRVVDAEGNPIVGAYVVLAWEGRGAAERIAEIDGQLARREGDSSDSFSGHARAGADGRFRFAALPAGLGLRFLVLHRERLPGPPMAVELVDGRTTPDVVLRAGPRR